MWKKEFDTSYTAFTSDGAQWLRENTKIKLIGIVKKPLETLRLQTNRVN
jgi:kynurenine formamidase